MTTKKAYQVQVNINKCGWMEIAIYEDKNKAEEELAKAKERGGGNPMFEHRIIPITIQTCSKGGDNENNNS